MRKSVEIRRRKERMQNRRAGIIVWLCGLLLLPLALAIFFVPGCDNMMGILALFQGAVFMLFGAYTMSR